MPQGVVEAVGHGLGLGYGDTLGPLWLPPSKKVLVGERFHLGHCLLDVRGHRIFAVEEDMLSGVVDMPIMNRARRHARAVEAVVERATILVRLENGLAASIEGRLCSLVH